MNTNKRWGLLAILATIAVAIGAFIVPNVASATTEPSVSVTAEIECDGSLTGSINIDVGSYDSSDGFWLVLDEGGFPVIGPVDISLMSGSRSVPLSGSGLTHGGIYNVGYQVNFYGPDDAGTSLAGAVQATNATSCDPEPQPVGSFVSFCDTLLLINDGNVDLVFDVGGDQYTVAADTSVEKPANYDQNGQVDISWYYDGNLVDEGTAGQPEQCNQPATKVVNAKALDQECDGVETLAHFVITDIGDDAPATISVTFNNGTTTSDVPLSKVTGGTAHYNADVPEGAMVASASAVVPIEWSGQFNLSHYECSTPPTTAPPTTAPPTTAPPTTAPPTTAPPTTAPPTTAPPTTAAPTTTVDKGLPNTGGDDGFPWFPVFIGLLSAGLIVFSLRPGLLRPVLNRIKR